MSSSAATPQYLTVADGRRIVWAEYGDMVGSPVLYCHGMPGSRLEHAHAAGMARERGLRIIVPDRPGYGESTPHPHQTVTGFADDAAAILDHLHVENFDIIGFSGGGPYAMSCASRLSERVGRLALVSSWAPFDLAGTDGMAEGFQQLWDLAEEDFATFSETLAGAVEAAGGPYDMLIGGAIPADQAIFEVDERSSAYRANLEEALRQGIYGMLSDAQALVDDWAVNLDRVTCPATIWHGTRDLNAPIAMGRWLRTRLKDAALTEWPDGGHFESFRRWDEVLDYLAHRDD